MMDADFIKPVEDLGRSTAEYVDMKIDDMKLRTAKGLSVTLNRVILTILFLNIGGIVLMAAAFGGVLLIGDLIGSYAAGAFIVSGFFLIVLAILFIFRNKLFLGGLVKMFVRLFFDEKQI